jgi:hypothetical protein
MLIQRAGIMQAAPSPEPMDATGNRHSSSNTASTGSLSGK